HVDNGLRAVFLQFLPLSPRTIPLHHPRRPAEFKSAFGQHVVRHILEQGKRSCNETKTHMARSLQAMEIEERQEGVLISERGLVKSILERCADQPAEQIEAPGRALTLSSRGGAAASCQEDCPWLMTPVYASSSRRCFTIR